MPGDRARTSSRAAARTASPSATESDEREEVRLHCRPKRRTPSPFVGVNRPIGRTVPRASAWPARKPLLGGEPPAVFPDPRRFLAAGIPALVLPPWSPAAGCPPRSCRRGSPAGRVQAGTGDPSSRKSGAFLVILSGVSPYVSATSRAPGRRNPFAAESGQVEPGGPPQRHSGKERRTRMIAASAPEKARTDRPEARSPRPRTPGSGTDRRPISALRRQDGCLGRGVAAPSKLEGTSPHLPPSWWRVRPFRAFR